MTVCGVLLICYLLWLHRCFNRFLLWICTFVTLDHIGMPIQEDGQLGKPGFESEVILLDLILPYPVVVMITSTFQKKGITTVEPLQ